MAFFTSSYKPNPFTGKQDIVQWINAFEPYAEFVNWNQDKMFRGLKNMIQEQAAQWLSEC